jgi:hypothetical protein
VTFHILKAASMKMIVFWDTVKCSIIKLIDASDVLNTSIINLPHDGGGKHL